MAGIEGHKITLEFLQEVISQIEPDITILSFKVNTGAGRGDNYNSMLYRVLVIGTVTKDGEACQWQKSIIVKRLPDSLAHRELYCSDIVFKNEKSFYKEAFASLLEYQNSTGTSDPFNAVPKCFLAKDDVIVLEDLKERGFVMVNRKEYLDYQHCVVIFREIARFHALSMAMKCRDPEAFHYRVSSKIQEAFFTEGNEDYFSTLRRNALEMVKNGLEDNEQSIYLKKFEDFLSKELTYKKLKELVQHSEPYVVVCHGDFWTNNIMFHYSDSGALEEVCFVDFQGARYCSPALDLVSFLYACTTQELRVNHTQALLEEYCSALRASLKSMSCELWENINSTFVQKEILTYSHFGLGQALDFISAVTCDSDHAPNLYEISDDVAPVSPVCNQDYQERVTKLVKEMVDHGLL